MVKQSYSFIRPPPERNGPPAYLTPLGRILEQPLEITTEYILALSLLLSGQVGRWREAVWM